MAEQEADDYLMSLGDGARHELMEDIEKKEDKDGKGQESVQR